VVGFLKSAEKKRAAKGGNQGKKVQMGMGGWAGLVSGWWSVLVTAGCRAWQAGRACEGGEEKIQNVMGNHSKQGGGGKKKEG